MKSRERLMMMNYNDNSEELDEKIVKRLINKILIKENEALKKGTSDSFMVNWIKSKIEEEVECN